MKILIADDEQYTREGLIESIAWERLRIDEIMQASNGLEAIQIAKWFHPDIVLTDIRMPKKDGIAFATELMEQNPDSQIIFMSGYMEVEYLKSAIKLSVVDYIEKPMEISVVEAAIEKAVKVVLEKQSNSEIKVTHKEAQQQKLVNLLCSKDADFMTIEKLAMEAQFPLDVNYVCIVIQLADTSAEEGQIMEMLDDIGKLWEQAIAAYWTEKKFITCVIPFQEKQQYRLQPLYQEILQKWQDVKIGVGIETEDYKNIYNSYNTAAVAINCSFYSVDKRFFQIDDEILHKKIIEPRIYGEFLQLLSAEPERLKLWFANLFEELLERKYYYKEQVYTLLVSLLTALFRQFPELYGKCPGILREEQIQTYLYSKKNLQEIQELVEQVLNDMELQQEQQSGYNRVIRGVIEYVSKHYGEESLSIGQIAEHLHFSPAYLNVLFKQEMKVTLKQYLSNYRIDRAKVMLEQQYDKISEIAIRCGYANANYFAKVFKDVTGVTPVEYRTQAEEKKE